MPSDTFEAKSNTPETGLAIALQAIVSTDKVFRHTQCDSPNKALEVKLNQYQKTRSVRRTHLADALEEATNASCLGTL